MGTDFIRSAGMLPNTEGRAARTFHALVATTSSSVFLIIHNSNITAAES
jgi:hypothetical protein